MPKLMRRRGDERHLSSGGKRFDRLTERAKRTLVLAEQEAQRLNHNYIGTEHLLLGLVSGREGIAATVLTGMGVELDKVRGAVELIVGRGGRAVAGIRSLTPRSKHVIELAVDEARRLNHAYAGTEHLLLGLVREGEGIAAGVLESLGADLERVRAQTLQQVAAAGSPVHDDHEPAAAPSPGATGPRGSVVTCRVDSGHLEAIDALVEAGICSTRSDAAAWLIHAGVQANLDLFDSVYSTIAEIRRLREDARSAAQRRAAPEAREGGNPGAAPGPAAQPPGDAP